MYPPFNMAAPGTQVCRRMGYETDESDHGDSTDARYVDIGEDDSDGKRGKHTHFRAFLVICVCVCKFACAKILSHLLKFPFPHVHSHWFLFCNVMTEDDREPPPRTKKVRKRSYYDSDRSESTEHSRKKHREGRSEQNIPQFRGIKSPSVLPTSYQNRSRSNKFPHQVLQEIAIAQEGTEARVRRAYEFFHEVNCFTGFLFVSRVC